MFFYVFNIYNLMFFFLFNFSMILMMMGILFMYLGMNIYMEWNLFFFNSININFYLMMDFYSIIFSSFVLYISSSVFMFSNIYMKMDKFNLRFVFLLMLFILSMLMLIYSGNLITILLGWDGLGLVSFLLVMFYMNKSSLSGSLLTVITNRIGDISLILSIVMMMNFGQFSLMFMLTDIKWIFIMVLIFLSAMTKSAQMPFSAWLPAAMAAPTPVSSLVHSSTLVTAGVYLMIRYNNMFMFYGLNDYLLLISLITMFMSGLSANFEFDLKKIIALSTLSQLSVMFFSLSMGLWKLAYFHLLTHALFKALMFLCAGSIMNGYYGNQDIRFKGSSINNSIFISLCMNTSLLALSGMPFLSGYYSKDMILEKFFSMNMNLFIMLILVISTSLTVCYSFRLMMYVFLNYNLYNSCQNTYNYLEIMLSLMMLMLGCMFSGFMLSWIIFPNPVIIILSLEFKITILFIFFSMIMFMMLLMYYKYNLIKMTLKLNLYIMFMSQMWLISFFSTQYIMLQPFIISKKYMNLYDYGWSEVYGGVGLFNFSLLMSSNFSKSNYYHMIYYYIMFMIWILMLLVLLLM
uniref:NADH-ubiquinone oxidoreductase chain 5 n=1 Tax=Austrodecus sp. JZ-2022 TaxID=2992011 RepID=A0A9E7V4L9_9CHEL|nr:NADH dehydrogenase subunit 5 [Austrodecus sp. JZ-2022]